MKTVVITGASGYVGGQTAIYFHSQGWHVVGIDRNHPPIHLNAYFTKFMISGFDTEESLHLISTTKPNAIVHCGGTSLVGPSVESPATYYENNFVSTKKLLDFLVANHPDTQLIFSSSAAVYGEPIMPPCQEEDPPLPMSPYGESKHMAEMMLKSYSHAYGLKFTAFRYFNVCGADEQGRHGQEKNATHIIARVLESILENKPFTLHGSNYDTPDGTCIRDYVHVNDIARAHFLAANNGIQGIYNLGTSVGASNQEVIDIALSITGHSNNIINQGTKRHGDPAVLTCSADKFTTVAGWVPEYTLEQAIQHSWNWYNREF